MIVRASKSEVYEYQQIVIIHSYGTIFELHYIATRKTLVNYAQRLSLRSDFQMRNCTAM